MDVSAIQGSAGAPSPALAAVAPSVAVRPPALSDAILDAPGNSPVAEAAAIAHLPPDIRYAPSAAPHVGHAMPHFETSA